MKGTARIVWAACTVFVLAAAGFAQTPAPNTEQAVKSAQQLLLEAARSHDREAARRLMTEDVTWVNGRGALLSREEMPGGSSTAPVEVIVDRVKMLGDAAVLTGSARWDNGEKVRFTQQWINRDGSWKLFAHQATALSPAPAAQPTGTSGRTPASSTPPTLRSDEERAVWQTQLDVQRAYLGADADAYARLTDDAYFRMERNGEEHSKAEFLETVRSNASKSKGEIQTADVQIAVNGDTARLVVTTWGTEPGGQPQSPTRVTRMFVKRNDLWRQAAAVFTVINQ